MSNKKGWKVLSSKEIFKAGFFRFRCEELELPNNKIQPRYYVMDFSDWVNVVALTEDKDLILIKQYRHGVEDECLEIPGGAVHPKTGESVEDAARRELIEETGYVPRSMKLLGFHHPNPALQSNRLWTYLALDCKKERDQQLDEYELIEVSTVKGTEALRMVKDGKITHSLVITGLHLAEDYLKG